MKSFVAICLVALCLAGCGGGGGGGGPTTDAQSPSSGGTTTQPTPIANSVMVTVDSKYSTINSLYVTLTVCAPGTSNCTTVDHVLVDTGSAGLRLLRSALPSSLGLANATDPNTGAALAECAEFGSGHAWGPVSTVDLKIAGETASSLPMQIVDDSYASVPSNCASAGADMAANGAASFGANGILGVSSLRRDCNALCDTVADSIYYDCAGASCTAVTMQVSNQLPNPISRFASDNNGVALTLPTVPAGGSAAIAGTMTFGINTQSNNALASTVTKYAQDSEGQVNATYAGQPMFGIIDSGSGAYFFPDSTIQQCPTSFSATTWFCPTNTLLLTAELSPGVGAPVPISFSVANAMTLLTTNNAAFSDVGIDRSLFGQSYLDLGLPYFYGKTIFVGLQGNDQLTAGTWPYWAVQS